MFPPPGPGASSPDPGFRANGALGGGAFGVEGEEAGEDLVAHGIGPAVAPGFPAPAGRLLFVGFVVEEELQSVGASRQP